MLYICGVAGSSTNNSTLILKSMDTKLYQTAKEFFKYLNNFEADIWIRGSKAYNVNGELIAEYNTKF